MKPKYLLLSCILFFSVGSPLQAQLMKKLKDKVNKSLGSDSDDGKSRGDKSSANNAKENDKGVKWCDTISVTGNGSGNNGVQYALAYSSPGNINILYDESTLGIGNDSKGYRMILAETVNKKTQYVVVENGKVIDTDTKVKAEYLPKNSSGNNIRDDGAEMDAAMKKYIVGDTLKQNIQKTDAKTVTIHKVDDNQMEMALEMARQTDDYKKMSDEDKKSFEETVREGMTKNNSMAGKSFQVPAQQGGTVAVVTGYMLVVKGKNYGKFQMPPVIDVSPDESKVFAVGVDEKGSPVAIVNGKKTALDKNKYAAMGGFILRSPNLKKSVYIEPVKLTEKEIEDMSKGGGGNSQMKLVYNVLKNDGTSLTVTDYNASGKFKLTNSGEVISINEGTGQVFADNKLIGKFPLQGRDRLESDAVMIGSDINQMTYYNGDEGSLTYLDGAVRKMDIMHPKVVSDNGKSYLSWFRKCKNAIYIARFIY